ncbi:MAG: hypothetical protein AAF560_11005 [Acidobacteriota bacterium]
MVVPRVGSGSLERAAASGEWLTEAHKTGEMPLRVDEMSFAYPDRAAARWIPSSG